MQGTFSIHEANEKGSKNRTLNMWVRPHGARKARENHVIDKINQLFRTFYIFKWNLIFSGKTFFYFQLFLQ